MIIEYGLSNTKLNSVEKIMSRQNPNAPFVTWQQLTDEIRKNGQYCQEWINRTTPENIVKWIATFY